MEAKREDVGLIDPRNQMIGCIACLAKIIRTMSYRNQSLATL
jgi:hypothetical protein